jgi:hypothetical protein
MSAWCEKTGISFTPTFFVSAPSLLGRDGSKTPTKVSDMGLYQLPEMYNVEDLKYLLG